jgi:diguanylate cyclase (GGDEF)-like protein
VSRIDARLREMQFLAKLDREDLADRRSNSTDYDDRLDQAMIASLICDGYVNGIDSMGITPVAFRLLASHQEQIGEQITGLKQHRTFKLQISHKGRVRLSELEQQLKTGRSRDPTGLCLARRHLITDLAIALTYASKDAPLSVIFLDMNGLKAINDTHGHHAGDDAIHAYLEAVVAAFGEHGEAYRGEGGDEVLVVLPKTDDDRAGKLLGAFVRQLGKEVVMLGEAKAPVRLTAACGSMSTTDPNEDAQALHDRADKVQYRAKDVSRKRVLTRVSTIAVGEGEVTEYAPEA